MRSSWHLLAAVALAGCADIGTPDEMGAVDGGDEVDAAAPALDATPAEQCVQGTFELLDNPGFDDGAVAWEESVGPIIYPDEQIPITPHGGSRAAWLGRSGTADQKLTQAIELPLGIASLQFKAQTCLVTGEEDAAGAIDTLRITVRDDQGAPIALLAGYSNLDAGSVCNWASVDVAFAEAMTAQPAVMELRAISAAGGLTSFYFDTLSLEATTTCP